MKKLSLVVGLVAMLLGALWLLQWLGWVHVRPILCFADCEPIQGACVAWAIIGLLVFVAASTAVFWSLKSSEG